MLRRGVGLSLAERRERCVSANGIFVRMPIKGDPIDTPRGLKPNGFSGNAHDAPLRERLKGLPGPNGR
jgi:hypothetical protein